MLKHKNLAYVTMQSLYKRGGRKFTIAGFPPLGCLPLQITLAAATQGSGPGSMVGPRVCVDQQNRDAVEYNSKLQVMIDRMGSLLNDTKFAYVDIYNPVMAMIQNPEKYGELLDIISCGTMLLFLEMSRKPSCFIELLEENSLYYHKICFCSIGF